MSNMAASAAQRDFGAILDLVINQGDRISIATDYGTAMLVSESEWNGMLETLYLKSIPGMEESILEGKATDLSDCLDDIGRHIN
jgi:PHD/YefM family antitoxin component YafN of YafNO toxin-antitoxin module